MAVEDQLIETQREIDRLMVRQAILASELDGSRRWERGGYNSAIDWLRLNCHLTSTVAARYLCVGRNMDRLQHAIAAVDEGTIGFAHLAVMAGTADKVTEFDETELLPLAQERSAGKFHYECLHYRHAVDAEAYRRDAERLAEQRSLRLSTAEDGCLLVSGILDPVAGAAVRGALEPLARKSGKHDDRTLEMRTADALYELCTGGPPAHLQVTASLDTLLGIAGAPGGETEFSVPLSTATVKRLACDSSVSRVLLDQSSVVIDVGRATHKIPVGLRKALELRDRHCRWPGCEKPASWCDGHHLEHWIHGGGLDLPNIVLLCQHHHWLVHEGGWQLVKTDDGELVPVAPQRLLWAAPRGPD